MEIINLIWKRWLRIARFIGDWIARVVLTVLYFTILLPFGIGVRIWGDPLMIKNYPNPKWLERNTHDRTLEDSRRLG